MKTFKNIFLRIKKAILGNAPPKEVVSKLIGDNTTVVNTILGENTSIGKNCNLYNSVIDNYSYLSSNVTIVNTHIGKFSSVAQGVGICLGNHPSHTFVSTSPMFFSMYKQCGDTFADKSYFQETGSCKIGNDVWIGANVIIKDDISIGNGVIIGAGAIVTKDIPDYAIVVGNPARILRYRFEKDQIDFLLKFKWWDKDENWLRDNFKDLHNIENFVNKHSSN